MKTEIAFTRKDVARVTDVVVRMADHPFVIERRARNVERRDIDISHDTVWWKHVGCLLTTQQKSNEDSPVQRFLRSTSPLLSLRQCEETEDVGKMAEKELTRFGGIRRTTVIPKQIAYNFHRLNRGGWDELDDLLSPLATAPQSKESERRCATAVDKLLKGFGPKQSRNLLQWLGLTRHEIPIDSRIIKWLRSLGSSDDLKLLSSSALGEAEYYCCIMEAIQALCLDAEVLPCIFDASIFASFENT